MDFTISNSERVVISREPPFPGTSGLKILLLRTTKKPDEKKFLNIFLKVSKSYRHNGETLGQGSRGDGIREVSAPHRNLLLWVLAFLVLADKQN